MNARRAVFAVAVTALAVIGLLLPAAAAAAPAPRWQVRVFGEPTNFDPASPDDRYVIILTNVGAAPTNKSIDTKITDTLPPGLSATSVNLLPPSSPDIGSLSCITTPVVQCDYPGTSKSATQIKPGDSLEMFVNVAVEAGAVGPLSDSVAVSGGGAPDASATSSANGVSPTPPPFGFQAAEIAAKSHAATPYTQAAGHPDKLTTSATLNTKLDPIREEEIAEGKEVQQGPDAGPLSFPIQEPRDISVDLPPGVAANPQAVPPCTLAEFYTSSCPAASQIGNILLKIDDVVHLGISGFYASDPLYNLQPLDGHAGSIGFVILRGIPFILNADVRSGSDYSIQTTQEAVPGVLISYFSATLWGVPDDPSHELERGQECTGPSFGCFGGNLPSGVSEPRPFLTMPTSCPAAPLTAEASADSWQNPGVFRSVAASMPPADGCEAVPFEPTIEARPTTTHADSPSGLDVDLHIPKGGLEEPEGLASSDLKDATVTLPAGLKVNPASASGLAACTEAQIGYKPATKAPLEFTPGAASCPDESKLGTVEIDTPLLDHPLPGAVYLAQPHQNPFGSLLALYIVIDDPVSGVIVKLAGRVSANPESGQLSATFEENPQVPFEDFHLHFFAGAQAALRTPATCGTFKDTSALTPWSAPESPATPSDEFQITGPAQSGSCAHSPGEEPNAPTLHAGTEAPQAGAYSPFALKLVREDGSQELKGIDTTLPPGLTGKLAGIPYCSEAQLAQARSREHEGGGAEEIASPSCPAASEVGTVEVGAGAGPDPFYVKGKAYLAGPYKGAPLSLAIVTPAVAGPFDLGAVVVRTALYVNPETAQIHAVSDPIPTILQGIPLDVRSITVKTNRPNFTLNPTSCDELGFAGSALSILGATAPLSQRFQVGGCAALGFKPKLKLSLKGGTKRDQNPALKAVLTARPGDANIAFAQVTLPHSEFLDQSNIKTICTRVQFAEGSVPGEKCPAASVYGFAQAVTPLLDKPVEGPVYLRSSSNNLPDLVAALNGQIDVDLDGKIDTGKGGGIRNTFELVPDAPVTKFTLSMQGGSKGLLVNSENLCAKKAKTKATVDLTGQNGKVSDTEPLVANSCKGKAKKKKKGHKQHKRRATRPAG